MKFKNFFTVFLIFAIPLFAFFVLASKDESVAQKAQTQSQPHIVKFSSAMCLDCKSLNATLKKIYPKYSDKILLTEIQVENNDDYTNEQIKKYGISLVPTTIFIDKDGNKVDKIEGDIEAQELEEMMKELINE